MARRNAYFRNPPHLSRSLNILVLTSNPPKKQNGRCVFWVLRRARPSCEHELRQITFPLWTRAPNFTNWLGTMWATFRRSPRRQPPTQARKGKAYARCHGCFLSRMSVGTLPRHPSSVPAYIYKTARATRNVGTWRFGALQWGSKKSPLITRKNPLLPQHKITTRENAFAGH